MLSQKAVNIMEPGQWQKSMCTIKLFTAFSRSQTYNNKSDLFQFQEILYSISFGPQINRILMSVFLTLYLITVWNQNELRNYGQYFYQLICFPLARFMIYE